jgi:hypothetical protein
MDKRAGVHQVETRQFRRSSKELTISVGHGPRKFFGLKMSLTLDDRKKVIIREINDIVM